MHKLALQGKGTEYQCNVGSAEKNKPNIESLEVSFFQALTEYFVLQMKPRGNENFTEPGVCLVPRIFYQMLVKLRKTRSTRIPMLSQTIIVLMNRYEYT